VTNRIVETYGAINILHTEKTMMKTRIFTKGLLAGLLVAGACIAAEDVGNVEGGGIATMPEVGQIDSKAVENQSLQQIIPIGIPGGVDALIHAKQRATTGMAVETEGGKVVTPKIKPKSNNGAEGFDRLGPGAGPCSINTKTGFAPPDIHGAAGPSRLVVVTNSDIGVYTKPTCTPALAQRPLKTLFRAGFTIPASETLFDPRVLYDQSSGRFLVTVESLNSANTDQFQYFAVSTSSTASAWRVYRFALSQGTSRFCKLARNSFWDYP
jgi:hypothetical protein